MHADEHDGEKVKRANKFETPGSLTDAHGNITGDKTPIVSMVDDTPTTKPKDSMPKEMETWTKNNKFYYN
jgi:hypothetical protein